MWIIIPVCIKGDGGCLRSGFVYSCVLFWLDGVFCLDLDLIEENAYKQK